MGNNDVFAVLADKTRRAILAALKDGERPVGDLVAELGVSQPTVSKHLKILRDAGMVSMAAQGQRRLYAVRPEPLAEVTEWVHRVAGAGTGPVVPAGDGAAAGPDAGPQEFAPEVPAAGPEEPASAEPETTVAEPSGRSTGSGELALAAQGTEVAEPSGSGSVPEELAAAEHDAAAAERAPAQSGTVLEESAPAPAPGQGAADAAVLDPQASGPQGPGLPAEDTAQRAGGGAGARAVGLLSNLPGFRRRPRHRRR